MRPLAMATVSLAFLALAACGREAALPTDEAVLSGPEYSLAASLSGTADSMAARQRSTMDLILRAFHNALLENDDPAARALLAASRAYADSGRAAAQAGDREAARRYFQAAHDKLFEAIVLVLPDAAERTGAAVDSALARIEARLDTAAAPRIRAVLALVREIRARADSALAAGDEGRALGMNVRAMEMLRTMHRHLQRPGGPSLPGDQGANPPPGDSLPPPPGGMRPRRPG